MTRTRQFDVEDAVRAARDVFWERGYASTSLAQLQAATGLSRSSLYETFGSKRGLFERAARNYHSEVWGPLLAPIEVDGAGRRELVAYFEGLAAWIREASPREGSRGCLMINTAVEVNQLDADAAAMIGEFRGRIHAAVERAVRSIPTVIDPEQRTDLLVASQIGLLVTVRLRPEAGARVADLLAQDVASW